ncbi:hypothetical protein GN956_G17407 [Arapaima gigas]
MAAVVNYSPPWWVNLLHRLPHFNLHLEQVSSEFRPADSEYQKASSRSRRSCCVKNEWPLFSPPLDSPARNNELADAAGPVTFVCLSEMQSAAVPRES